VPLSHKNPFDYSTHKPTPNLRPKPTSTPCMQDGWMDGWMGGVDKKQFFILFYPHTNYPHASTYLPTYLIATKSEAGIRNCTKPSAPLLRVSKLIIMIMKQIKYPVSIYNHGSQKIKYSIIV